MVSEDKVFHKGFRSSDLFGFAWRWTRAMEREDKDNLILRERELGELELCLMNPLALLTFPEDCVQ